MPVRWRRFRGLKPGVCDFGCRQADSRSTSIERTGSRGRGILGGGDGPLTGRAAVAPLLGAVDADGSAPELPPCGAVGVVAGLGLVTRHEATPRNCDTKSCRLLTTCP